MSEECRRDLHRPTKQSGAGRIAAKVSGDRTPLNLIGEFRLRFSLALLPDGSDCRHLTGPRPRLAVLPLVDGLTMTPISFPNASADRPSRFLCAASPSERKRSVPEFSADLGAPVDRFARPALSPRISLRVIRAISAFSTFAMFELLRLKWRGGEAYSVRNPPRLKLAERD